MYKDLSKYVCDKYYYVETRTNGNYKGYMLNYDFGNIVMLTSIGILHIPNHEIIILKPISNNSVSEKLEEIVEDINKR